MGRQSADAYHVHHSLDDLVVLGGVPQNVEHLMPRFGKQAG